MRMLLLSLLALLLSPSASAQGDPGDLPPARKAGGIHGRGAADLVALIDPLLNTPAMAGAKLSVVVARAEGGAPLYAYHADTALHPASNVKLVTTAAALALLGPQYTFKTDLAVDRLSGGVAGEMYLVGRGDPGFLSESLWKLVNDARVAGLKRVKGDLVVDDTFFTRRLLAPGFASKTTDAAYRAATGAASLNYNAVRVKIVPGKAGGKPVVTVLPESAYALVVNTAKTRGKRERLTVSASRYKGRTRIKVGGSIPKRHAGLSVRRRIDAPARYTGETVKAMLARAGIRVDGKVRVGKAPKKRRRLGRYTSRQLGTLAGDVNKHSNNFMAEQLVRTLGKRKGAQGDWAGGTAVVTAFLEDKVGLKGFHYVNGSGLFGKASFSGRHFVKLLQYMHARRPRLLEFAASLAVAGRDGTLRKRLRKLAPGTVRAKTGTLNGVVCISGYVELADGSLGVFSMLMNDLKGKAWRARSVQDQILKALAAYTPATLAGR